ncbi:hypothetical protein scyTo_0019384, partial [Scyliorhinus torazame]|nr:hypothetical protein [Scyliorhinus torazame]
PECGMCTVQFGSKHLSRGTSLQARVTIQSHSWLDTAADERLGGQEVHHSSAF